MFLALLLVLFHLDLNGGNEFAFLVLEIPLILLDSVGVHEADDAIYDISKS